MNFHRNTRARSLALSALVLIGAASATTAVHAQSLTVTDSNMETFDDRGYHALTPNQTYYGGPVSTSSGGSYYSDNAAYSSGKLGAGELGFSEAVNSAAQYQYYGWGGGYDVQNSFTFGTTTYTVNGNNADGFDRNIVTFDTYGVTNGVSPAYNSQTFASVVQGGIVVAATNSGGPSSYIGAASNGAIFTATNEAYNTAVGTESDAYTKAEIANAPTVTLAGAVGSSSVTFTQTSPNVDAIDFSSGAFTAQRGGVSDFGNDVGSVYDDSVSYVTELLVNGVDVDSYTSLEYWGAGDGTLDKGLAGGNSLYDLDLSGYAPGSDVTVSVEQKVIGTAYGTSSSDVRGTYNLFDQISSTQDIHVGGGAASTPEPGLMVTFGAMAGMTGLGMVRGRRRNSKTIVHAKAYPTNS